MTIFFCPLSVWALLAQDEKCSDGGVAAVAVTDADANGDWDRGQGRSCHLLGYHNYTLARCCMTNGKSPFWIVESYTNGPCSIVSWLYVRLLDNYSSIRG